jgi:hypothetical protein
MSHSLRNRLPWPDAAAEAQKSPWPEGTVGPAATHSPAAARTLEPPASDGRGSRLSGHSAAGTGDLPVEREYTHTHLNRSNNTHTLR